MNKSMDNLAAIIVAGGSSSRFGGGNKLFELYHNIPVFIHSIQSFLCCVAPERIILVVNPQAQAEFAAIIQQYLPNCNLTMVPGGNMRGDSVKNGLAAITDSQIEYVAIHDAARPKIAPELIEQVFAAAKQYSGAIPGQIISDTVKRLNSDGVIVSTVDRTNLCSVETPQIFHLSKLRQAYLLAEQQGKYFTDDAAIMENAKFEVKVVLHEFDNIKITFHGDLLKINRPN